MLAYRRTTEQEDLEARLMFSSGDVPLAVVMDHSQSNQPLVQLTHDELKWLCFTVGPDILRAMEAYNVG